MNIAEFFEMGGYAVYVWPAYGLVAVTVAGLVAHTLYAHRAARRRLRALEREPEARA